MSELSRSSFAPTRRPSSTTCSGSWAETAPLAEDLTQEVFLRVYQGLPKFSLRSKFTTWLFQVTKNRVLDELRATERRPRALVAIDDIAPLEVLDAPIERLEEIDALWRAVENLSTDLKMALLLRDVVGLSYTEIADSLEVTLATVKWRIYKAREEVQIALVREGVSFGRHAGRLRPSSSSPQPRRDSRACCCAFGAARDRPHYGSAAASAEGSSRRRASPARHRARRREHEQRRPAPARGGRAARGRRASARAAAPSARRRRRAPVRSAAADAGRYAGFRASERMTASSTLARHAGRELADGRDLAGPASRRGRRATRTRTAAARSAARRARRRASRRPPPPSPPRRAPAPARGRPQCRAPSRPA